MAQAPLRRCTKAGCRKIQRASRCEEHKTWQKATPKAKHKRDADNYDFHWKRLSRQYREENPLCVHCLYWGRIRAAEAVDHIIPIACVPALRLECDNLCSICWSCHNRKTAKEPKHGWMPIPNRIVLCGLPATGKTTLAKQIGLPYFDADDMGVAGDADAVRRARTRWIAEQIKKQKQELELGIRNEPMGLVVIASHPTAASQVAATIHGTVRHCTLNESERQRRFDHRKAERCY